MESWKLWWCLHGVGEGALPPESCSRAGDVATVGVAMSRVCGRGLHVCGRAESWCVTTSWCGPEVALVRCEWCAALAVSEVLVWPRDVNFEAR